MELYICYLIGFVLTFYLLFNICKIKNLSIAPFLLLLLISNLYEFIFTRILKIDTEFWFLFYDFISFPIIIHYLSKLLNFKNIIFGMISIFYAILYVLLFNLYKNYLDFNGKISLIQTLVFVIFTILYFIRTLNLKNIVIWKEPDFYFVSAIFIYYTSTVVLFYMSSILYLNDQSNFLNYWSLNIYMNIFFRILIAIGLWRVLKK